MNNRYTVELEVAGPLALFARPDTGSTPTSYPVPTWSAAKGVFESIAFLRDGSAWIDPVRIEVCRPVDAAGGTVHYQRYTTNYRGPLRKPDLLRKGASMQLFATVLRNVCYRLHGEVVGTNRATGINTRHFLKALFGRRLKQGRCFRTPFLGWTEFTASYWGPFRDGEHGPLFTERDRDLNLRIPSLLRRVFELPITAVGTQWSYKPSAMHDIEVKEGVLRFDSWSDLDAQ
ncbi:MAG: CRISPR-associated protein Cas5 [Gemmatimonadaceae bacterium]